MAIATVAMAFATILMAIATIGMRKSNQELIKINAATAAIQMS